MTENTPDAVKVAREALADRCDKLGTPFYTATAHDIRAGKLDDGLAMRDATLGARAMQAAMPAPCDDAQHGWVCWNNGPCAWFWSATRERLEHELSDDIRPATVAEKALFGALGGSLCPASKQTAIPAPDVPGLVERLSNQVSAIKKWITRHGGIERSFAISLCESIAEAASRIEALEAEVVELRAGAFGKWCARLTTENAALRAEVERKDKALRAARSHFAVQYSETGKVHTVAYPMEMSQIVGVLDAALAPAKAGG